MTQLNSEHDIFSDDAPPVFDTNIQVDNELNVNNDRPHGKKLSKKAHKSDSDNGEMACASTIMTMDISKQMFLVGDVFMRKFYTVFDRDNDRVGLATAITNDKIKALNQI